jgi:hypothetical protein
MGDDVTDENPPFGLGALPDDPDPRDFGLDRLYEDEGREPTLLDALPTTYVVPGLSSLPVLNQGSSPECVAYSSSAMKRWQDRRDQLHYYDFAEHPFFVAIGGTAAGAQVRWAMDRMLHVGYPLASSAPNPGQHKIAAYYAVPATATALRQAIVDFGPVVISTAWFRSWFHPTPAGVLPDPDVEVGGHAILAVGWSGDMLRLRNSWGAGWGAGGDCFLPDAYLGRVRTGWKAIDVIERRRLHVRPGFWWAYTRSSLGWKRTRRWTGGFSADCTVPVTRLVLGKRRPMSRILTGAYRGLWVNAEGNGITVSVA